MKNFIVVDANNHWLAYGEFKNASEAYYEATLSSDYDETVEINVYECASKPSLVKNIDRVRV